MSLTVGNNGAPMPAKPTLSVVVPTFNCAPLMERHLASMALWADLADEIIVVDSRSTDGTIDMIRERLRHPNVRIIERDRGLYASWNEGIAATSGEWVYISTAGDTIEREHLCHLLDLGERAEADVVISPPRFVDEAGRSCRDLDWPPAEIVADSRRDNPFTLSAEAAFVLTFIHCPSAILGSSASNLYRGDHLRARPFPVDFNVAGDSVWILRHAAQARLCFTPHIGSTFSVHPKESEPCREKRAELVAKLLNEKRGSIALPGVDEKLALALAEEIMMDGEVQAVRLERRRLWHGRPRTAAALCSWIRLSFIYFRKRNQLRKIRARILGKFLPDSCYQTIVADIR
jgi:hypothetical protein